MNKRISKKYNSTEYQYASDYQQYMRLKGIKLKIPKSHKLIDKYIIDADDDIEYQADLRGLSISEIYGGYGSYHDYLYEGDTNYTTGYKDPLL